MKRLKGRKRFILISITAAVLLFIIAAIPSFTKENLYKAVAKVMILEKTLLMKSDTQDDITFYFREDEYYNDLAKYWYNSIIPEADSIASKLFPDTQRPDLGIVILGSPQEMLDGEDMEGDPIAYYVDDTIFVSNETINKYIFIHEYGHYITDAFYKENNISLLSIPTWFNEGIAEYLSLIPGNLRFSFSQLKNTVDFKTIENNKDYNNHFSSGIDVAYQSCLAIAKLVELAGEDCISRVILNSKNMDFYSAFEQETKMTMKDFEAFILENQRIPLE